MKEGEKDTMNNDLAKSMTEKISINRIMPAISADINFKFSNVSVLLVENVPYKEYQCVVNYNGQTETHLISALDEEHGRELRDMKKKPQNIYAALVTCIDSNRRVSTVVLEYEKGNAVNGALKVLTSILQVYLDWKNITTAEELQKIVNDYEDSIKRKNQLVSKINTNRKYSRYKSDK